MGPRTTQIADAIVAAASGGTLKRGRLIHAAAHVLGARRVGLCAARAANPGR